MTFNARLAVRKISAYRRAFGLPPVEPDDHLMALAQRRARAMAARGMLNLSHSGFAEDVRASGYSPGVAGENLAAGQPSFDLVFSGWKKSAGHNANLLLRDATHAGIGTASNRDAVIFWVLVVAGPELVYGHPVVQKTPDRFSLLSLIGKFWRSSRQW
jgi:uncharacterized protein YkwD